MSNGNVTPLKNSSRYIVVQANALWICVIYLREQSAMWARYHAQFRLRNSPVLLERRHWIRRPDRSLLDHRLYYMLLQYTRGFGCLFIMLLTSYPLELSQITATVVFDFFYITIRIWATIKYVMKEHWSWKE